MSDDEERGKTLKLVLKILNIIVSIILIVFGVLRYFDIKFDIEQPWILFQPAYTIMFGLILILSEMNFKFITENLRFLQNYTGRGLFIIYLSTLVTGNLQGQDITKYGTLIIAVFLLITGILYIFIHCCCADKVEEQKSDENKKLVEDEENKPRNSSIH